MRGRLVSVVPLADAAQIASLYEVTHGPGKDRLWQYLFAGPFATRAEFCSYLEGRATANNERFFTIVDNAAESPVGFAAYLNIEPAHRRIEVGSILYAPAFQRTPGATEAMYLMARHVFEDLGYRRYEWKCDALNMRSRQAALRLGFSFEGIFRQHMIVKGRNRDTAWFSMLDSEWPQRKASIERWLDPSNFDDEGRQRCSLSSLHGGVSAGGRP
jgi:RimJ/RimL family protein N-acetyltransferase